MTRVAICVVTRCRPNALARLLRGLAQLRFRACATPDIRVVIVDNDAGGSAHPVVAAASRTMPWPIRYAIEPRRGIPIARNTAIELAGADTEYVAFLDDDEVPAPQWLDELLATQVRCDADIVTGPVIACFERPPAPWLQSGGFYSRRRYLTGSVPDTVATNNVLFRSSIYFDAGIRFSERMALTGGEDTLFFLQARRAGFTALYADTAQVEEWLPASRLEARWLLARAYSGGNSFTRCLFELEPALRTRASRLVRGCGRIFVSVLQLPAALLAGRPALLRALMGVMVGAGTITAVFGSRYDEYRTIHGS